MNAPILLWSVFLASLLTGAQVLFKVYATTRDGSQELWQRLLPLGGALFLYVTVFALYAVALRRFELSQLYPAYTAVSVLLTFAAGIALFRESLTMRGVLGCALLVVAVFLISTPEKR